MRRFLHDYSLSVALAALFLISWVVQIVAQVQIGEDFWEIAKSTFENWQSEFLQLLTFVVLTSFLIHRGSHESRDGDDEMKAMLQDALQRLERLERR